MRAALLVGLVGLGEGFDTQLVSFDSDGCPSDGLHYEIAIASGSCVHLGSRLAMAVECSLENAVTRRYWERKGPERVECAGTPDAELVVDEAECVPSAIFGGRSYTQVCQNSATTEFGVRIEYFRSLDECDDDRRSFGATIVPHSCYNIRMDVHSSFKYFCEDNRTVTLEKWVDHDRCGGVMTDEFTVPSGACLPGGHEGNAYETIAVRYTCDGHELTQEEKDQLAEWDGESGGGDRGGRAGRGGSRDGDRAWWASRGDDDVDDGDDGKARHHRRKSRALATGLAFAIVALVLVVLSSAFCVLKDRARTKQLVRNVNEALNEEGLIMQTDGTLVAASHRGIPMAAAMEVEESDIVHAKGEYCPPAGDIELPTTPTSPVAADFAKAAPPTAQIVPTL